MCDKRIMGRASRADDDGVGQDKKKMRMYDAEKYYVVRRNSVIARGLTSMKIGSLSGVSETNIEMCK